MCRGKIAGQEPFAAGSKIATTPRDVSSERCQRERVAEKPRSTLLSRLVAWSALFRSVKRASQPAILTPPPDRVRRAAGPGPPGTAGGQDIDSPPNDDTDSASTSRPPATLVSKGFTQSPPQLSGINPVAPDRGESDAAESDQLSLAGLEVPRMTN